MINRLFWIFPFVLILIGCDGISKTEKSSFQVSDSLRQKASKAKEEYKIAIYDILTSEAPALEDVFRISRNLQIAMTHRGDWRYEHLWKNNRSRIKTNAGYLAWLNLDWRIKDERKLMTVSSEYSLLQERIKEIKQKNQGHPMWPEARKVFRKMQNDVRMTTIHEKLQKAFEEIDEGLKTR